MNETSGSLEQRRAELKRLTERLERFRGSAREADPEMKIGYGTQVHQLLKKRDAAQEKLEELEQAGGKDREELRRALDKALLDLKTALETAETRFE
ncbi:MAG: hypothetical protein GF355_12070 [Candidatus Eisenbacteria bacterium]|nr:hypothetical protein [Candidatus Eisenbacteria bacterium]